MMRGARGPRAAVAMVVGVVLVGVPPASARARPAGMLGLAGGWGTWTTTATQADVPAGTVLGPTAPATPLHVVLALQMRNPQTLNDAIARGEVMTRAQFTSAYAPTVAQAGAAASYLTQEGFRGVTVSGNRLLVSAMGTVAQADSAFATTIADSLLGGLVVHSNLTAASVPSSLAGTVGAVLGLTNAGVMAAQPLTTAPVTCAIPGLGYPCTYTPQGFWTAYDATRTPTGSGTPIAVIAEGDLTGVIADLRSEEAANGLPAEPVSVVPVGLTSTDTSGADEWDLDTQYSTGMAGSVAHLYLYDATSLSDSDLALAFNAFASQDVAVAGSASLGECEYQAYLDGSLLADDQAFAEAAAQGQTMFASAGDTGGFCAVGPTNGVPLGLPDVNYPASSPYVVGVGGTTLVTGAGGAYGEEAAWVGGGGGVSLFELPPTWQNGVVPPVGALCALQALLSCGRSVPDIAMDADPNSGAEVTVAGIPAAVGGTSLASPLSLGVWARLESASGNHLGFASPVLYRAYGSAGYHDIVLGDTVPWPALPGYDLATGMGSVDVAKMLAITG